MEPYEALHREMARLRMIVVAAAAVLFLEGVVVVLYLWEVAWALGANREFHLSIPP